MSQTIGCKVCGSPATFPVLTWPQVPVHQNFLVPDQESARRVQRGDLDLVACRDCGFIFNQAFDLDLVGYDEAYDNAQEYSAEFRQHVQDLIRELLEEKGVRDCRIVEVGCGKGAFLRKLVEQGSDNRGHGFDPSYTGPDSDLEGRLTFHRRYYDASCAHIPADVVVCRHVIEHVPDPVALLSSVRQALAASTGARVFFETPCMEWILKNRVVWDLFYEHCSYFSPASLRTAFELAGLEVKDVRHVFGGQYLWLEATLPAAPLPVSREPGPVVGLAECFRASEAELTARWRDRIRGLAGEGSVAVWGAGAKGVTFTNLIDPECRLIECVVDINPQKQGCFLPGTGHPIVDYRQLPDYGVAAALLMNPNYRAENLALLAESDLDVRLVQLEEILL